MEKWRQSGFLYVALAALAFALLTFALLGRLRRARLFMASERAHRTQRRWFMQITVLTVLSLSGVCYGAIREEMAPRDATSWLGASSQLTAEVTAVYPSATGASVYLLVTEIEQGNRTHRAEIRTRWHIAKRTTLPTVGEEVRIAGVVTSLPTPESPHQRMPLEPPTYGVSGRLLSVKSSPSPFLLRVRDNWLGTGRVTPQVSQDHQNLAASIVFGADGISRGVENAFLASGLLHVLAASGANIVLLEVTLNRTLHPFWRWTRLPFWSWALLLIAFIWAFAGMCAFQASIVRAAIMTTYRFLGTASGRKPSVAVSLSVAAAVMTVLHPYSMLTPSAWLSFAATGAIMLHVFGGTAHRRRVAGAGRAKRLGARAILARLAGKGASSMVTVLTMTLRIELWVAPIVLLLFGQVTPYGIVANLFCEPLIGLVLPVSLIWLASTAVTRYFGLFAWIADPIATVENYLIGAVDWLAETIAHLPGALWNVTGVSGWWVIMYYTLLTGTAASIANRSKLRHRAHFSVR